MATKKATTAASKKNAPAQQNSQPKTAEDCAITAAIQEEHKYTLMMVSVLKEQLAEFDIGKTPDYEMMSEVVAYMGDFPQKYNHKRKDRLISDLIEAGALHRDKLESLVAERQELQELNKETQRYLKTLTQQNSILQETQLKIFCKNFLELSQQHISIEQNYVLPQISRLDTSKLKKINSFNSSQEQLIADAIEERYQDLTEELNQRWEEIEDVASGFALAELLSVSAFFEAIDPVTQATLDISDIMKKLGKTLYQENSTCYGDILTQSQASTSDYYKKPLACVKSCFGAYKNSLGDINQVLKKAKDDIYEPYKMRKNFFYGTSKPKK